LQEFPLWIEKEPLLKSNTYEAEHMVRNLILIGFMGTGKTTVGRSCAQRLKWSFIDTDHEIERELKCTIAHIFHYRGEEYFRQVEVEVLQGILQGSGQVIATGGGIVTHSAARALLEQSRTAGSRIVWLKARPGVIMKRVGRSLERPLLNNEKPLDTITDLLAKREHWYQQLADAMIDTSDVAAVQVVETVLNFLDAGEA
jgi:shikimate kinase